MLLICNSCGFEVIDHDYMEDDECPICGDYMIYENEFENGNICQTIENDDFYEEDSYEEDDGWDFDDDEEEVDGKKINIIAGNIATAQAAKGCFESGTRILMSNGIYKNIEEINIGDEIINKFGKSIKVKNVIYTGSKF